MSFKHLINSSDTLVVDSLRGLCELNPQLTLDVANKVVYVADRDKDKVALVCGGGSGHEPAHGGFVGRGMLSAAVCGSVFASPNASQVRRGIDLVESNAGQIIIVKNYTGDVLNFGLAREQHAALHPGTDRVKFLIVGDDVAVGRSQGSIVGRRGLAGVVLVYKIAGALAERGATLDDVYSVAEYVSKNLVTIGVGLEHCHVPGTAAEASSLGADEIEIGLGIHNESGTKRISPVPSLEELVPSLLEMLTSTTDEDRSFVPFAGNDDIVLLVNNFGGLSELELNGVVGAVSRALRGKAYVKRVIAGTFMTSLNMPGFSITLLLLPPSNSSTSPSQEDILSLLDDKPETPGWRWTSGSVPGDVSYAPTASTSTSSPNSSTSAQKLSAADPKAFTDAITRACQALSVAEPEITRMDTIAGDGDCGLTLQGGANGVLDQIKKGGIKGEDLVSDIVSIAKVAEESMGGTSGALYSIFFSALAQGLHPASSTATPEIWKIALEFSLAKLYTYTRARRPSRTLVDPLDAFVTSLSQGFPAAVSAASEAAENTKNVKAKAGRSAYVQEDLLIVGDPGAFGVKIILEALSL